jgi:hypothetical protein
VRRIRCAARVVLRCFLPSPRDALRLFRTCHGRADLSVRYVVRCLHGSRDGRALLLLAVRWVRPWVGTHTHSARQENALLVFARPGRACTIACSQPTMAGDDVFRPAGQCAFDRSLREVYGSLTVAGLQHGGGARRPLLWNIWIFSCRLSVSIRSRVRG